MRKCLGILSLILCAGVPLAAQEDRDFLTPNEVDQIRDTQEPNARLTLYVHFAKERIDLLQQYLAKQKSGRSLFIHNTLEDYSKIIEAIDSVSDDALRRKLPIDKGNLAVVNAEKDFLTALNKIHDADPPDLSRYEFVLQQAIDTTSDSRELCLQDAQRRGSELAAGDAKEKAEREAMMPQKEVSERKKQAQDQSGENKKVPSLYRPGEKKPDTQ
ncbi:MAG: hypothetical protein JO061_11430 [Acidobacteriaceae bacterium]|nr:hypothetical protein [Acidobacteriaceae bacterium]